MMMVLTLMMVVLMLQFVCLYLHSMLLLRCLPTLMLFVYYFMRSTMFNTPSVRGESNHKHQTVNLFMVRSLQPLEVSTMKFTSYIVSLSWVYGRFAAVKI